MDPRPSVPWARPVRGRPARPLLAANRLRFRFPARLQARPRPGRASGGRVAQARRSGAATPGSPRRCMTARARPLEPAPAGGWSPFPHAAALRAAELGVLLSAACRAVRRGAGRRAFTGDEVSAPADRPTSGAPACRAYRDCPHRSKDACATTNAGRALRSSRRPGAAAPRLKRSRLNRALCGPAHRWRATVATGLGLRKRPAVKPAKGDRRRRCGSATRPRSRC